MSRYFVVNNASYSTYEAARAQARALADSSQTPVSVDVFDNDLRTKTYVYRPTQQAQQSPAPQSPAPQSPDIAALEARVEALEAALAELLSAQAAKPRRARKAA
jgi:hypothetical protein